MHPEGGGREEVLRDGPPQVPDRLDRRVLLPLDEGLGIEAREFAELAQEVGGGEDPEGRHQVGPFEGFTQPPPEFAVHADVHVGIRQLADVLDMAAQREDQVDLAADAFDQPADLREVGGHVEGAVDRPDDVDARLLAVLAQARLDLAALRAEFGPQPVDGAVGGLPLVLVDGARDEALQVGTLRRHAAADHLGDRTGHHHGGKVGVLRRGRALHRAFGAGLAQRLLVEARHHDRQLMRRQRIRVVQHRRHRQVLAAHRPIDHHTQPAHRGECVDGAPVAPCPVVIEDEHGQVPTASSALAFAARSLRCRSRKPGGSEGLSRKP